MKAGNCLRWLYHVPTATCVALIRGYQWLISPWLGQVCRFEPSCSNYMLAAIHKYGVARGVWRGALRIARCHPFHPGGYDPP
jgi:hypothetical protein